MHIRLDFLIKDNQCEKAIEDFKILASVPGWLIQYSDLYNSASIKPKGLPRITSSHFGGEIFVNIQLFSHLYETVNSLFK
ncbi:MAG: hypothetical protein WCP61_09905 [Chitinophagia bacterium]